MAIFKEYDFYGEQFKHICEWVKLLQRMNCNQKIRVFIEGRKEQMYEETVCNVTFTDLENLASCSSGGILDIAAKDDVIIITLQENE